MAPLRPWPAADWRQWDSFYTFVVKRFGRDVSGDLKDSLGAAFLDSRYELTSASGGRSASAYTKRAIAPDAGVIARATRAVRAAKGAETERDTDGATDGENDGRGVDASIHSARPPG